MVHGKAQPISEWLDRVIGADALAVGLVVLCHNKVRLHRTLRENIGDAVGSALSCVRQTCSVVIDLFAVTDQLPCEWSGTYVNGRLDMVITPLLRCHGVCSGADGKRTGNKECDTHESPNKIRLRVGLRRRFTIYLGSAPPVLFTRAQKRADFLKGPSDSDVGIVS